MESTVLTQEQLSTQEQMDYLAIREAETLKILEEAEAFTRLEKEEDFQKVFGKEALSKHAYMYVSHLYGSDEQKRTRTLKMLDGLSYMVHMFEVKKALKDQCEAALDEIKHHRHTLLHPEENQSDVEQ